MAHSINPLTVLSIVGTRPEAVKMAPVISELALYGPRVHSLVCSVGQHRELLDPVLDLFGIRPDVKLQVMRPNQSLSGLTASLFSELDLVLEEFRPDWVLAQGDTTSVFVAGMAAYYRGAQFGHVEAGLRTGNKRSPFPEEVNRRFADILADLHFAPTERARRTLLEEGCPPETIHVTGNTVVDALHQMASRSYRWEDGPLSPLPRDRRLVLVTAHRRESFGDPFRELCLAIRDLAVQFGPQGFHFAYPVHLNPNVQRPVREILGGTEGVTLLPPVDYLAFVHLLKSSVLVLTDSGGVQEEAPGLGVPVLVMRETTERPEGIECGAARLVGTCRNRIVEEASRLLENPDSLEKMSRLKNPYGDGRAAERIVSILLNGATERDAAQTKEGEWPDLPVRS